MKFEIKTKVVEMASAWANGAKYEIHYWTENSRFTNVITKKYKTLRGAERGAKIVERNYMEKSKKYSK